MSTWEQETEASEMKQEYDQAAEYSHWIDHPQVQELIAKLAALTATIDQFEATMTPLQKAYEQANKEYDSWEAEMRAEMRRRKEAVYAADVLRNQVKSQMLEAKQLKAALNGEVSKTVQQLEAEKRMAETEERWQLLLDEGAWLWKGSIRPFQMTCTKFIVSAFFGGLHGVLVADQMGLGKTLEAEAALDLIQSSVDYDDEMAERIKTWNTMSQKERQAVLVVVPNSIKVTTRTEYAKWNDKRLVTIIDGPPAIRDNIARIAHSNGLTLVVNYETLSRTPALQELVWPIVVLDEAHSFGNEKSQTFELVERICRKAGFVLPMTGTPINNKPDEYWAILHMLTLKGKYAGKFDAKWRFIDEYCYKYGTKTSFQGKHAIERLTKAVANMVIRRRKDEVELELPDKVREVRYVQMGDAQRQVYDQMRDQFYVMLQQDEGDIKFDGATLENDEAMSVNNPLAHMTRLRQIALYPKGVKIKREDGTEFVLDCNESAKMDEAMVVLEELIENDEKCLVFATTNAGLFELQNRIKARNWTFNNQPIETAALVGGVNPYKKNEIVNDFNDPQSPLRIVVGNIKAMGIGLNLQGACSNAIFLDLWWSPGKNEQAEDRLHRGGQKSAVTIHIMQAEDCIDAFIAQKLDEKQNMIDGVMNRKELRQAIEDGLI